MYDSKRLSLRGLRRRPAWQRRRRLAGRLAFVVFPFAFASLTAACGSRTGLDVCTAPGESRPCQNACGAGTQTCAGPGWTACEVPIAERTCENACGSGSQTCESGAWSVCAVAPTTRSCTAGCGAGSQICTDGAWSSCDAPEAGAPSIEAQLWDFQPLVPADFGPLTPDASSGLDLGIVEPNLGADDTPVYAGDPTTPSTTGAANFALWYHQASVNLTTHVSLPFGPSPGNANVYASNNTQLFPVDGQLFGNEDAGRGNDHNYYFTLAFVLQFRYRGGETFQFGSDDDSFVFINRKLAVNLGGRHGTIDGSVALDAASQALGIAMGQTYPMHVFYADRRPIEAVLEMQVPAVDFAVCPDGGLP